MAKLTLSVDDEVIAGAKEWAGRHGTSISKIVERHLQSLTAGETPSRIPPHIASLIGIAKGADPDSYKKHLLEKYK